MGDERRVDRINVAKSLTSKADDPQGCESSKPAAAAGTSTMAAAIPSSLLPDSEGLLSSELVAMQHQIDLQNIATYQMLERYHHSGGLSPPTRSMYGAGSGGRLRGFGPSFYGGGGAASSDALMALCSGSYSERAEIIANMSLFTIERDIQNCLEAIAVQKDRLAMLRGIKEMKLGMGMNRRESGEGMGGAAAAAASAGYNSLLTQNMHR
jgi:hypothetical protein